MKSFWTTTVPLVVALVIAVSPPAGAAVKDWVFPNSAFISGPRPWIDPIALGAKVDGATDDTPVWNRVFASVPATGATIIVPQGTSIICGLVLPAAQVSLIGYGPYNSILKVRNGCNQTAIRDQTTAGLSTSSSFNDFFALFQLDGNRANQAVATQSNGIWGFASHYFLGLWIVNVHGDCLRMGNDGTLTITSGTSKQWHAYGNRISGCDARGVAAYSNAGDFILETNRIQQDPTTTLATTNHANIYKNVGGSTIVGNELYNGTPAVLQSDAPFGAGETISSNMFQDGTQHGIQYNGSAGAGGEDSNVSIVGNSFYFSTLDTTNLYSAIRIVNNNAGSPTRNISILSNHINQPATATNFFKFGIELANTGGGMSGIKIGGNTYSSNILTAFGTSGTTMTDLQNSEILRGTSGSIGGGALAAGACATGTLTIAGATTAMVANATPNTYPGDGVIWNAQVTAANTVTVKVCAIVGLTPTASTYNVRIIQ